MNFYDPLTIPIETNSNSVELLTLLIIYLLPTGIGIYIIWLTYSQYRVREYHSTKPKEEKLRILKIYLNKMWGHCGGEDHNNIFSYTYTKKLIYQEVNLIIYIDDEKLMFNTYDSRFYVFDFGLSRRAARNLNTFLKAHL